MTQLLPMITTLAVVSACAASSHSTAPSQLGTASNGNRVIELSQQPGPVELEPVIAANWKVDRAGMINLEHPSAKAAGLEDGEEPIVIAFYVLRHPKQGTYMIDSGVASAFRSEATAPVSWLIKSAMDFEALDVHVDTRQWLERNGNRLDGVFLTHIHLDHVMGMPDVPSQVPVYTGPGEADASDLLHLFSSSSTDEMLGLRGPLLEWTFERDPSGRFAGVVDIFGDGSVFALHVPGHTPGSTAFLVRTPNGPELVTGDVSHTRWGWVNRVEPGTFTLDAPRSVTSFAQLKTLERDLPGLTVHLGHQHLDPQRKRPLAVVK